MQRFDELVERGTGFTLQALEKASNQVLEELKGNAHTSSIKNLQMLNLQKAVVAIGAFSLFEAILQDGLGCENGFAKAREILLQRDKGELYNRFQDYNRAINVLKHGKGDSYNYLLEKANVLPFKIKLPNEEFFIEGDVSEVATLIEVTDEFVLECVGIIRELSEEIRAARPDFYF